MVKRKNNKRKTGKNGNKKKWKWLSDNEAVRVGELALLWMIITFIYSLLVN